MLVSETYLPAPTNARLQAQSHQSLTDASACIPCLQAEFSRRIAQLERDSKWKMENREAELVAQNSAKLRQVGGLLQASQSASCCSFCKPEESDCRQPSCTRWGSEQAVQAGTCWMTQNSAKLCKRPWRSLPSPDLSPAVAVLLLLDV